MITLDEVIKVLPDFEPFEVFDIDANITYSEEEAEDLIWHEYGVERIYSLTDKLHHKSPTAYTVLEVKNMLKATDAAYLRMVEERLELVKKVEALSDFLKKCRNNQVNDITLNEIHLLEEQFRYMNGYLRILTIRISKVQL